MINGNSIRPPGIIALIILTTFTLIMQRILHLMCMRANKIEYRASAAGLTAQARSQAQLTHIMLKSAVIQFRK